LRQFRYSRTFTNTALVAWPIKMQDLHKSTCWVILNKVIHTLFLDILIYFGTLSISRHALEMIYFSSALIPCMWNMSIKKNE